jgi:hypothetical protein
MAELKPVYALSISGRMTLEMHSLNNEGGEGNQITTRTVALVEPDGTVHTCTYERKGTCPCASAARFSALAGCWTTPSSWAVWPTGTAR